MTIRPSFARARLSALVVPLAFLLCACATAPVTTRSVQVQVEVLNAFRKFEHAYLVQPGDQLEVYLHRHTDISRKVTVRPDGYVTLPLLGEVKAAGRAPGELAAELKRLFTIRLKEPDVDVIIMNPPEPMVYVVGQVGAPKALPLRQASTLAQAIAQAGDATRHAAAGSISVVRLNSQGQLEAHVVQTPGGASQPEVYMAMGAMLLKANDLIVVPESYRSQVVRILQDTSTVLAPLFNVLILREIYR